MNDASRQKQLRELPSVHQLANQLGGPSSALACSAARQAIAAARERLESGLDVRKGEILTSAASCLKALERPSLIEVINATGVILHTNLGRAPLPDPAVAAVTKAAGNYSNLEFDLDRGRRARRDSHVEKLLCQLSGAEAATVVNNNAAAVLLALTALAVGGQVLVSRGELIEIGGSFRIPEVLAQSGATLREVGTTNRTRATDYDAAAEPETVGILRVHQSNFRTVGFVERPELWELAKVAREQKIFLIEDLGSGAVESIFDEPVLRHSVSAGVDLACASADKLLGGPQAGLILGTKSAVDRCRAHPLARAVRIDKLQLAALETTLSMHRDERNEEIPALAMMRISPERLERRAKRLARGIGPAAEVTSGQSRFGGGTLPLVNLPSTVCQVASSAISAEDLTSALRRGNPPIVARIEHQKVILDPRTIFDDQIEDCIAAVRRATGD